MKFGVGIVSNLYQMTNLMTLQFQRSSFSQEKPRIAHFAFFTIHKLFAYSSMNAMIKLKYC
jgi:hypothetical protein